MSYFGHPLTLSTRKNAMMWFKERHPLLLECSILYLKCLKMTWWASGSICNHLMVQTVTVLEKTYSQIAYTISDFRFLLCTRNWMLCCKERHPLLLECFITFLRCIIMIGRASDIIKKLLMVYTVSFLHKITLKSDAKYQFLGNLSTQEMGYNTIRRDIHCCLSVSWHSLDV